MLSPSLMIASTVLCYAERAPKYFLMRRDKTTCLPLCVCTYAHACCGTNTSCLVSPVKLRTVHQASVHLSSPRFPRILPTICFFLFLLVTFRFPCQCMTAVPSSPQPHHCPSPPSTLTLSCQSSEAEGSLSHCL